ncbi:hypothetical protein FisN_23Hu216 [Fistulifera solaris]|uniref:Histidine kinase domain-containing protein n=1 Tax=Fistulifera solaris TaxID=1519565 RepID=A0A1Z5JWT9_FISSO|nr:hypothetical protein FisN_23Hu216 [Fistulifera solaris]|eukprot:GAX18322.1 hypothetical protein FisN_23Hu216 [Fistulifera solaris]
MWYFPSPVLIDEYSGLRFHMVRWAEWTALAFIMTFLTCNLQAAVQQGEGKVNFVYPTLLALSTFCGMLFPLCRDATSWWIVMTVAWLCFNAIYVLVYRRRSVYYLHKITFEDATVSLPHEANIDLSRSAYNLALACASTWTMLSVVFTFMCFTNKLAPTDSWLNHPANPVVFTTFFEIVSKVIYLSCIFETYDKVFDQKAIAFRRLEEMRNFMCAVWASSSDAIVYVLDGNDHISARISPAFLKLIGVTSGRACSLLGRGDVSLIIDISPSKSSFTVFAMDLTKEVTREDVTNALNAKKFLFEQTEDVTVDEANIVAVAELILHETKIPGQTMKVFHKIEHDLRVSIPCEATVANLEGNSRVVVLRDISDRLQRFEAEKLLIEEVTSRKKDTEANNFTRHEVKNGILASIGILDHIKELMAQRRVIPGNLSGVSAEEESRQRDQVIDAVTELDSTLHEILDTIRYEAMAKEIVYGEYAPRKDALNVRHVLDPLRQYGASKRFPLHIKPDFPRVCLDRQLLRYIYRNALSNACRYGQHDGTVESFVLYDRGTRVFTLKVTNLPGEGHTELLDLDDDQVRSIFEPGVRLAQNHHPFAKNAQAINKESSGNGAWIMQKCAECLGGSCSMKFNENGATFTFVSTIDAEERPSLTPDTTFCLPAGTWGIFIDDSGIQRKLMDRFLAQAGIEQSRRVILGANADEIYSFVDTVIKLVSENPNDKFLLIADENLDIEFDGQRNATVSGSLCVEQIIGKLDTNSEKRLLALIRSANDSMSDLNLYRRRSHGFLKKEPLKSGGLLEIVKPFWTDRFLQDFSAGSEQMAIQSLSDTVHGPSEDDLLDSMRVIRALSLVDSDEKMRRRWHPIRDRLHALKGDLMSMISKDRLVDVLKHIDNFLAHPTFPEGFLLEWEFVEHLVERTLTENLIGLS